MASWQKRARLGVALFGVAFAGVVYLAIGDRQMAPPAAAVPRFDPKAIFETTSALLQQVRGTEQDFAITADRTLNYEDGSTRQFNVRITVRNRGGRDFVVTARQAVAGKDQIELQLSGDVKLVASDGFELTTDAGTFDRNSGVARAPGTAAFRKGRMSGTGAAMTYDQQADVLVIGKDAKVVMTDEAGNTTMDLSSGTATLDRMQDLLTLEGSVHVLRNEQVIEADAGVARMSDMQQFITAIELRGNSRVSGGSSAVQAMSGRDIDLHYSEDGTVLQRVVLTGAGAVAMSGTNDSGGRQLQGDSLDLQLADDGAITRAVGNGNVRLDLLASATVAARTITAQAMDANGEPGKGLTGATFTDQVMYTEHARGGAKPRVARSRVLRAVMSGDAVSSAVFTGNVTFTDGGLEARSGEARYVPDKGTLLLTGADDRGVPHVADEQITIDAVTIDIGLEGRRMSAKGMVKTALKGRDASTTTSTTTASAEGATKLPGLLKQDAPANVQADALEYDGASGSAVYTGSARLWQGETSMTADRLALDQERGDLVATGNARSTLVMDTGVSTGRAHEIRYDDAKRVMTYRPLPASAPASAQGATAGKPSTAQSATAGKPSTAQGATAGKSAPSRESAPAPTPAQGATVGKPAPARGSVPAPAPSVRLTGPQGDLQAERIDVVLAREGSRVDRLEAYDDITMKVETRTVTGARLTYFADEEKYVVTGAPGVPFTLVAECRETRGRTLTFFKSTDNIIVDGNGETRTQTSKGGPCTPPSPR